MLASRWLGTGRTLLGALLFVAGAAVARPSVVQADSGAEWLADLAALAPASDSAQSIDTFSAVIRVPRRDLVLFAGLQLNDAGLFPVALDSPDLAYQIRLGTADAPNTIAITGAAGRATNIDLTAGTGCVVTAEHYCSYRTFPRHAYAGSESFFLVSASGHPGIVAHTVAPDDRQETTSWSVSWYVPGDDVTYSLSIAGKVGPSIPLKVARTGSNPNGMGPANLPIAQTLLDLTDSFIGIIGDQVVDAPPLTGDPSAALMALATGDTNPTTLTGQQPPQAPQRASGNGSGGPVVQASVLGADWTLTGQGPDKVFPRGVPLRTPPATSTLVAEYMRGDGAQASVNMYTYADHASDVNAWEPYTLWGRRVGVLADLAGIGDDPDRFRHFEVPGRGHTGVGIVFIRGNVLAFVSVGLEPDQGDAICQALAVAVDKALS